MAAPLVTIENCTASQIVGQETFHIATGTLSVERTTGSDLDGILLLKIAESSFALSVEKDAIVGTKGDRSYVFSKKLKLSSTTTTTTTTPSAPAALLDGTEGDLKEIPLDKPSDSATHKAEETVLLVQIDMPATASESNLTKFEKILVDDNFLLVGPQADADNLSRAFLEWTGIKTRDLSSFTAHQTSGEATKTPAEFSQTTHTALDSAASGSTTFAEATAKVSETINAGVSSIGSFIGAKLGTKGLFSGDDNHAPATDDVSPDSRGWQQDTKEAVSDGAETIKIAGVGLAEGAKHAGTQVSDATTQLVEHHYGSDAAKLKTQAGTTLQNAGAVGVTAMEQTSTIAHGVTAGQGALAKE